MNIGSIYVNQEFCDNTLIINNKEYKMEKIWRIDKNDKTRDAKGELFPYPIITNDIKHQQMRNITKSKSKSKSKAKSKDKKDDNLTWKKLIKIHPEIELVIFELHKLNAILDAKKKFVKYEAPRDCLICDKKSVSKRKYLFEGYAWEDGLIHYIKEHFISPSNQFKNFILNDTRIKTFMDRGLNVISKAKHKKAPSSASHSDKSGSFDDIYGRLVSKNNKKYVMIDKNQLLILDALMIHGGYKKKYFDNEGGIKRYSEHAGFLDFEDTNLSKIIVSGKTTRIDEGDDEIFLPLDLEEMLNYEYIFHTHPPTPSPGGRAVDGIIYEVPSIGDIYHFIDHHNQGNVIGSLVIASEGLYNIRKKTEDTGVIDIDEDLLYKKYQRVFNKIQNAAIEEYGTNFTPAYFYTSIAQDMKYINQLSNTLNEFNISIDFYPRKKDDDNNWIIDTVFLVFREGRNKNIKNIKNN